MKARNDSRPRGEKYIRWTDAEWDDFTRALIEEIPVTELLAPTFKMGRVLFNRIQLKAIPSDRQRSASSGTIDKATKKIVPMASKILMAKPSPQRPATEQAVADLPAKPRGAKNTKVRWSRAEWRRLSGTLERLYPNARYRDSGGLAGLTAPQVISAQVQTFEPSRRRPEVVIKQTIAKIRHHLLIAFQESPRVDHDSADVGPVSLDARKGPTNVKSSKHVPEGPPGPTRPTSSGVDVNVVGSTNGERTPEKITIGVDSALGILAGHLLEMSRPFVSMLAAEVAKSLVDQIVSSPKLSKLLAEIGAPANHAVESSTKPGGVAPLRAVVENSNESQQGTIAEPNLPGLTVQHNRAVQESESEDLDEEDSLRLRNPNLYESKLLEERLGVPGQSKEHRPHVAVVGLHRGQAGELRKTFTQLRLTCLDEASNSSIGKLSTCDRVIAHGSINQMSDGILARSLQDRYSRVNEGIDNVKIEINNWLKKGGTRV